VVTGERRGRRRGGGHGGDGGGEGEDRCGNGGMGTKVGFNWMDGGDGVGREAALGVSVLEIGPLVRASGVPTPPCGRTVALHGHLLRVQKIACLLQLQKIVLLLL
jgi:hypothetical protein